MSKICIVWFLFYSNVTMACLPVSVPVQEPPRFLNGKWIESEKPEFKVPSVDFKKLLDSHSVVFSGTVELAYTENSDVTKYIYTNQIWKGNVLRSFEIKQNLSISSLGCPMSLIENYKYIYFAEMGTRKNPIIIMKVYAESKEISNALGEPIKRWINGEIYKK